MATTWWAWAPWRAWRAWELPPCLQGCWQSWSGPLVSIRCIGVGTCPWYRLGGQCEGKLLSELRNALHGRFAGHGHGAWHGGVRVWEVRCKWKDGKEHQRTWSSMIATRFTPHSKPEELKSTQDGHASYGYAHDPWHGFATGQAGWIYAQGGGSIMTGPLVMIEWWISCMAASWLLDHLLPVTRSMSCVLEDKKEASFVFFFMFSLFVNDLQIFAIVSWL